MAAARPVSPSPNGHLAPGRSPLVLACAFGLALGSLACSATGTGSDGAGGSGGGTGPSGSGGTPTSGNGGTPTTGSGGAPTGAGGSASGGRTGAGGGGGPAGQTGTGGTPSGAGGMAAMNEYWIGPNGSNSNPGTQAAPLASVAFAHLYARPGVTFWLLPGTYNIAATTTISTNGTAASPINLFAAPGARPMLNYSTQAQADGNRGFNITADYWHMRGFEIRGAGDNCVAISGSHNTIEDIITDFCQDTGIQITVSSTQSGDLTRGAYNTILNCDSHDNFDAPTGENADGIDAKLDIGPGNVFRGCRSWNNSDDGYDLFGVTQVVTIDNCWAMLNGHTAAGMKGPDADGNGFKLGGNRVPAVHVVSNSFAMTNDTCGFTLNSNTATPKVTACGVNGNKSTWCDGLQHSGDVTVTMTGAQAIAAPRVTNAAAGASTLPAIK